MVLADVGIGCHPPDMSRCPQHGLALSPTGECVLCQRERRPSGKRVTRVFLFLGAALVAIVAAGLTLRAMNPSETTNATTGIEPEPLGRGPNPETEPGPRQPLAEAPPQPPGATPATPVAEPPPRPPVQQPPAPDNSVSREQEQARYLAELAMARRRVPVTVYATSWCPNCDRLRDWLRQQRISFREHDVDDDARARETYRRLNPGGSVPTIDIDGRVVVGFSPQRIAMVIDQAARERMR